MRFLKDPDATLDFEVDWSDWLNGDTIVSAVWFVQAGITKVSDSHTGTVATLWLSGGTVGAEYDAACRITTSEGRIDERTITVKVVER